MCLLQYVAYINYFIDEVGNKFYIILSGKVGVHIRMPKIKIEGEMN